MRKCSNLLLPAFLALLTALPAAGMVLRPCDEGALPESLNRRTSNKELRTANGVAFASQFPDSAVQRSIFCGSDWSDLPASENPVVCANDPVNLTDPQGSFFVVDDAILLGLVAANLYAWINVNEAAHDRPYMTIADSEYQRGLALSGAAGFGTGLGIMAAPYVIGTTATEAGLFGWGAYATGQEIKQGNYGMAALTGGLTVMGGGMARMRVMRGGVRSGLAAEETFATTTPRAGSLVAEGEAGAAAAERTPAIVRSRIGPQGELKSAFAKIEPSNIGAGTPTTAAARDWVRVLGNATDDAGHAIGNNLGGRGGRLSGNIFPQTPSVNRGAFAQFEQQVARLVQNGDEVFVRVVPKYAAGTTRPSVISYQVRVNGRTITRTFANP